MSIAVMSAVWALDLPDSQKIVLLALADCANDEGLCWPSMATLTKKCSKGERTIQGVIKALVDGGHLSRDEVLGKGCKYIVHPRRGCAPAENAPRNDRTPAEVAPPQRLRATPAAAADKPSKNPKSKHTEGREREKPKSVTPHIIPTDWMPREFGPSTKSRAVIDSWPPGELEAQVEHFTAHHRSKGNRFTDWQDAWQTWVLNSRRYGANSNDRRQGQPAQHRNDGHQNAYVRVVVARQSARAAAERGDPGGWPEDGGDAFCLR